MIKRHPSRLVVVESKGTGERFLWDFFGGIDLPEGFIKVTGSIPTPEKYWDLPIL